jgi:rifampicin phosphotransferase
MGRSAVMVIDLAAASDVERVGGKAAGLARLFELGLPVPPGVVLPAGEELEDAGEVTRLLGEPLAVRSSAIGEDSAERSAAGQYDTMLGVARAELDAAVARVRESARSERARAYGSVVGSLAVVIQRQISATRSGVAFTRDPVTRDDVVYLEAALGAGEAVVAGEVTPDRYWIRDGAVRARASGRLRALRDDEALEVAALARRAETGFGTPVDVEFCFERRRLWLVQCRPITTL